MLSFIANGAYIMPKIKIVAGYAKNSDGLIEGELTVNESTRSALIQTDKDSLAKETKDLECFELNFKCKDTAGNEKTITNVIFNGNVNPTPTDVKRKGTKNVKIFNLFTTTLLRLEILTEDDLKKAEKDASVLNPDDIMAEFLAVKDLPVRFKTHKNKKGFDEVDISTVEIIKDE